MHDIHFIVLVFLISLLVASVTYKPVLRYAKKKQFLDAPEERKLQRKPIPVMGGLVGLLFDCSSPDRDVRDAGHWRMG